jgi:hypothetical protein
VEANELLATVADLARRAGADEPDRLARTLTLLLGDAAHPDAKQVVLG